MEGGGVWVLADSAGAAAELATLGRSLGGPVLALVADRSCAGAAGGHGAAVVEVAEPGDALVGDALAAAASGRAGGGGRPRVLLFPMTPDGRDAGARLSARWDRPVLTNATSVAPEGDTLVVGTAAAGGVALVRTAFRCPPPWLVGVLPRAVRPEPVHGGGGGVEGAAVTAALRPEGGPRVLARHAVRHPGPALEEAPVVVAGGRGVGSAEAWALLEELAGLLGGAVGATRPAIDAGWAPHVAKVGLTGASVAPEVYLAFGLSGAAQHTVGMAASRHVIAVNTDRYAPILGMADLGVVGDAPSVLRRLVAALREARPDRARPGWARSDRPVPGGPGPGR